MLGGIDTGPDHFLGHYPNFSSEACGDDDIEFRNLSAYDDVEHLALDVDVGGVLMNLELRLSVASQQRRGGHRHDHCAKLAKDRGLAGPIHRASAYFCKHLRVQMPDDEAHEQLEAFIRGE